MPHPFLPAFSATPQLQRRQLLRAGGAMLAAGTLGVQGSARAQGITTAAPAEVGLSPQRLSRIGDWLRAEVAAKKIPGAVVMVLRRGKLAYVESVGQRRPDAPGAMQHDDIFRIYSMSKPIVSVAAMMLVEDGKLLLEAPVAAYIPAFANVKVGVEKADAAGNRTLDLVAPVRPMTVQDLLRHTSGLTYGFFGGGLVKKAYLDSPLGIDGNFTNAEFADHLAKLPLAYQPGSTWDYSHSTDILARVVEVVSGQSLGAHLKQRLLDPLGMADTSFYVPEAARQARIAEPFADDRTIGANAFFNDPRVVRKWESGGGGMVGTAPDYARFLLMLRNGGQLDGRRTLSPRTVEYMTSNHLSAQVVRTPLYLPGPGYGFGLGFAVRTATGEAGSIGHVGEYNWGGAGGTAMWVDPASDLITVFMMQSPKQRVGYRPILRNLVYGSLTEAK